MFELVSFFLLLIVASGYAWPDGAPCLASVLDSMNPLEAVEHQGGLQLSDPPYRITVQATCYNPGNPIQVTLEGDVKFKGFLIQPLVLQGSRSGQRSGEFTRLDDNGSWQFQCFRRRDTITHSHDEGKGKLNMWWKGDFDGQVVQFVGTVVQSLRVFWVKSVISKPIAPCNIRADFSSWIRPAPTMPPPAGHFKIDSFANFNGQSANLIENSIVQLPIEPPRKRPIMRSDLSGPQTFLTRQPPTTTIASPRRLTHIIPLQNMEFNKRTPNCKDDDSPQNCLSWIRLCTTSIYMQNSCRKTCRMC